MVELGRLERLSARQAWPHEAQDFTPWLLANADALGEVLGMDLELSAAEHGVGDFSLDLIGVDVATDERVIVENQLAKSDHSHLGQLLTYAGGTDAVNIVWIADGFRSEHRAALDWLNERTDERTRFFAVEVSAVRIGGSALAPLFEVVVQPNDWQKEVRSTAQATPRTPRQETYRRFWGLFLEALHGAAPGWTNTRTPLAQNWMNLPAGSSVAHYAMVFAKEGLRVENYFSSNIREVNEANFERFEERRAAFEAAFGAPLEWDRLDGKKACRISFSTPGDLSDEQAWGQYVEWFVANVLRLRNAVEELGGMPGVLGSGA